MRHHVRGSNDCTEPPRGIIRLEKASQRQQLAGHYAALERAEIRRRSSRLTRQEKLVLALHYHEGLTMLEIGAVLGLTELVVVRLHRRALLCLRSDISPRLNGEACA